MDNLERKTSKKAKNNKKLPMKVVYISNPMKFKISASEFRALVQELTGQDSELPADPSKFIMDSSEDLVGCGNPTVLNHPSSRINDDDGGGVGNHAPTVVDLSSKQHQPEDDDDDASLLDLSSFDDYFIPQMFENFYQQD